MLRCRKGAANIGWLYHEYDLIVMKPYCWHVWARGNSLCQCLAERWVD